jgi:anti-anti-sigma factor
MQIHEAKEDGVLIVAVQGHVDTMSATQFESHLLEVISKGEHRVCIDCSGVAYVNSAGLKGFLVAAKELDSLGGKLVLCAMPPNVRAIFEMIGFTKIIPIVSSREEALQLLAEAAAA